MRNFVIIIMAGMASLGTFAARTAQAVQQTHCFELCIMQGGQEQIALYLAEGRPEWADHISQRITDYAACAITVIEKEGQTLFADFRQTDALIRKAAFDCVAERRAFDTAMTAYLLEKGYFKTADEAYPEFSLLRAMAFMGAITNRFDTKSGSLSRASDYFVSRLPLLYDVSQREGE